MKILGIDSSGLVAGVAIEEDGKLISEYMIRNKLTHSQTLLPMIDEMMQTSKTSKEEIEAIAISEGPGSFTGLRIGSATAKGLDYGLGLPVIPVSSLLGLAFNLSLHCLFCLGEHPGNPLYSVIICQPADLVPAVRQVFVLQICFHVTFL